MAHDPNAAPPASQPARPALVCPLCGGPNACAPAASGDLATPCWCRDVKIPAAVLAKVPETERGLACICRQCAQSLRESRDEQKRPGP